MGVDSRTVAVTYPAMIIGVTFTHWLVSRSVAPRVLPKLAVDEGYSLAGIRH